MRVASNKMVYKIRGLFSPRVVEDESCGWQDNNLFEYTYFDKGWPASYDEFFLRDSTMKMVKTISDALEKEARPIYPELQNVWRAMLLTPLKDLRCVILGQDPYHSLYGETSSTDRIPACGVAFHVKPDHNVNPSMANILKELEFEGFAVDKTRGDLSSWTQQGVLLLNTALTVAAGEAESHLGLWRDFISAFLEWVGERVPGLLWGSKAISYKSNFAETVCTKHPSPLAAASGGGQYPAFFKSLCFKKVNELLKKLGKPEIKWDLVART